MGEGKYGPGPSHNTVLAVRIKLSVPPLLFKVWGNHRHVQQRKLRDAILWRKRRKCKGFLRPGRWRKAGLQDEDHRRAAGVDFFSEKQCASLFDGVPLKSRGVRDSTSSWGYGSPSGLRTAR